ncbi:MAG TPA: hypothetical protein VJ552_06795 [Sediminibacterium sp.]|nr:hypothetical protein [Sediminibacterium sp.]
MNLLSPLKKELYFRVEMLLLIAPILFFGLHFLFYQVLFINPYLSTSVPLFLSNNLLITQIAALLIPYVTHCFLREQGQYHELICKIHIMGSVFLVAAGLFTYQIVQPAFSYHGTPLLDTPQNELGMEAGFSTYLVLGAQLLLQLTFLIFAMFRLFLPAKKAAVSGYGQRVASGA